MGRARALEVAVHANVLVVARARAAGVRVMVAGARAAVTVVREGWGCG